MADGTTVIVNQQMGNLSAGKQQNTDSWTTETFGCFEDCGGCIFAYFLFPCYLCQVASKMRESCMVGFCLGATGIMAMRTKLRTAYGIRGSICGDFCCAAYCPQLTACQIDRELNARGVNIF